MKKEFLKFPARTVSYLPKMVSRRMRIGTSNFNIAYKSDGDPGEGGEDDSPEIKAIKDIGTQVEAFKGLLGEKADAAQFKALTDQLEALQKDIATMKAEDITAAILKINDENAKIYKQLVELQEEKAQAKDSDTGKPGRKKIMEIKDVEHFAKNLFVDGKKSREALSIEIKAAETFGYATFFEGGEGTTIDAFTGRMIDPTLYERKRKRNMMLDYFDIQTINVPKLIYLIKVEVGDSESPSGEAGGAEWILSGQMKPKRSFRVTTGDVEAKKVAIFGTVEDELLQDVSSLENWIREDFTDEMYEEINDGLLNNDPDVNPDAPLGLKTNAIQYTPTPAFDGVVTDTTEIDAIFAVLALMAYNKEEAGRVFVSSDMWYRIQSLKDNEARYLNDSRIFVNTLGQLFIGGVPITWVDEEDVPSTHLLVVARDLGFKIKAYGNMVFERGLNGEDFRYDRTSYRGYQRFLTYIPENRYNSVFYDTFANVIAAISAGG